MSQASIDKTESSRETLEFSISVAQFSGEATKDTIDVAMVVELLCQLLLTASLSHRTFLEQQENCVRDLMQRLPDDAQLVEAELAKVYHQIKASFNRLAEAIGDNPLS